MAIRNDLSAIDVARRLRDGEVIALPTETVYGLAADAGNPEAVAQIFALKGRPPTNPLIVHAADADRARRFAADWPAAADVLARAFWPGPLSIVVRRGPGLADAVTAGGDTVALRVPRHPLMLAILDAFDGGVAAPSANRSNYVSPTAARHVVDEFGDAVDVIDGGPCAVGIESTVIDVSGDAWRVLRPGGISAERIEQALGGKAARSAPAVPDAATHGATPSIERSPGQRPIHYAPRTPAFRFEARERQGVNLMNAVVLEPTLDPETYARNLYARLRLLDTQGLDAIYIELPPDTPAWHAIRDRLLRATRPLSSEP